MLQQKLDHGSVATEAGSVQWRVFILKTHKRNNVIKTTKQTLHSHSSGK